MDDVTALVLAGGRSRRMGRDKTKLKLGDCTMLERACAFGRSLGCPVLVAAGRADHFASVPAGCRAVFDDVPGCGPLAGLCAGLAVLETEFALVYAADMPFLSADAAALLRAHIGTAALCLFQTEGRPEPLFGLYRRSCLTAAQQCLDEGILRLRALCARVPCVMLDAPEQRWFVNCNTPEEWEAVRKQVEADD